MLHKRGFEGLNNAPGYVVQTSYQPRKPVQGLVLSYHCCDECDAHYATPKGLEQHKAFVHAS